MTRVHSASYMNTTPDHYISHHHMEHSLPIILPRIRNNRKVRTRPPCAKPTEEKENRKKTERRKEDPPCHLFLFRTINTREYKGDTPMASMTCTWTRPSRCIGLHDYITILWFYGSSACLILFIWIHTILSYIAVGTVGRRPLPTHRTHARHTSLPSSLLLEKSCPPRVDAVQHSLPSPFNCTVA
jgi:hypothetical protein